MTGTGEHQPVLLEEVMEVLAIHPDGWYVDATFGRGGHTAALLSRLGPNGRVLAIDRDPEAIDAGRRRFAADPRVAIRKGRFSMLRQHLEAGGWLREIDGILLDLGVSSPQVDDPVRGFSFQQDGPLDMRMSPDQGATAADWLAAASETEIEAALRDLGEERFARRIARNIVVARHTCRIERTSQLVALVERSIPRRDPHKHPATRTFQALRLVVNDELAELRQALPQCVAALKPGGRLAVITFHSLEDRIVKQFIRAAEGHRPGVSRYAPPLPDAPTPPTLRAVGRSVTPSPAEQARNPRARSARLRAAEKVAA
ncbi:MAG TPA: 16S rRNA (cytosine(1402)-N(4))-methyltransferase RsmH [Acidiferrobacteraceae bacterium]|nr:16S rRNA (cytosine(1402)-N(4))-methyltransferase RsmH [Acidiferrobacteraceae bacterium]